jgi:hypothetical protein
LETVWDWLTVFAFAGLATLLLQRSSEAEPRDKLWQYAPPAIGCALSNWLGNPPQEQHILAAVVLAAVVAYAIIVLKVRLPGKK